ncbi:MAG: 1-deoxy-D-xylulose-5-phosphate synthase, partial [Candidatus Hydrogenedentes bacterium]|nr:1-deoxy-D-xylulose-5-phosphate synthase [Candidatus Hydrogenedentota bacterium]
MHDKYRTPEEFNQTPILNRINSPADVRALSLDELSDLADDIRRKIIAVAATSGGHLAPHLGVVELTLAIHHVFDMERDLLIWDVG